MGEFTGSQRVPRMGSREDGSTQPVFDAPTRLSLRRLQPQFDERTKPPFYQQTEYRKVPGLKIRIVG
jgi:hypothetical protein